MKDIILITIYTIIFLTQILLIKLSIKKRKLKIWTITYGVEITSIIIAFILMIYYLQPSTYTSQNSNENLYIFIAFNIYTLTFLTTYIIGIVLKFKKKRTSKIKGSRISSVK